MVQRRVADLGLLGEQVAGFPEQRSLRVQHGPDHPGVEVGQARRGVSPHQLPAVGRRATDHRMHQHGQPGVGDLPESCGIPVAEGVDEQFKSGPPAQRRPPGQQAAHH